MTKSELKRAEKLFEKAKEAQQKFWDILSEVEDLIGEEIDSNDDLATYTLEDFIR